MEPKPIALFVFFKKEGKLFFEQRLFEEVGSLELAEYLELAAEALRRKQLQEKVALRRVK